MARKSDAIVVKQRCIAITKRRGLNRRCRHITTKSRYFWQHLKKEEGFRIMKSKIPGAGLGLFWEGKKPIPKGKKITGYTGRLVRSDDPNYGDKYALEVGNDLYIDSRRTNEPGLGRWENDKLNRRLDNTRFSLALRGHKVNMVSTKKIKPGTELTVPYGANYWNAYGRPKKAPRSKRVRR